MDIEKFKNESKVTYVRVSGDIHGVTVMKAYAQRDFKYDDHRLNYSGYVAVPFSYEDFKSFGEKQQKAICEAELLRSGLCIQVKECNPEVFYE